MVQFQDMTNNKGKITCDKRILLSIISLATKEISGVSELVDTPSLLFKRIFNKYDSKGVMIKIAPNGKVTIDVYIKVFAGVNVSDICFRIQENIKNNIASMVELKTGKINVHIMGVNFLKQQEDGSINA
ncbi:MAG: Asp23/Gls24 family envelope stress response protein [Clostridiales bacterium]|nr:Asp23/Gls24 family envelope stress response protein [Clostridiales bacterium]